MTNKAVLCSSANNTIIIIPMYVSGNEWPLWPLQKTPQ